jgi:ABC-type branched-subunit amino acid transport system substrate-binding protein
MMPNRRTHPGVHPCTRVLIPILLLSLFGFSACAPKQIVSTEPVADETGEVLFLQAEDLFVQGVYEDALQGFQAYLDRFPAGPLADAAVMKIATIYGLQNEGGKALETYQYLIATYPDSPFKTDATLEMMLAFYAQNRFESVIAYAAQIPQEAMTPGQKLRVRDLLGSSYLVIGDVVEAVYQFLMAYELSLDEDRKVVRAKLENAIDRMTKEDTARLVQRLATDANTGWLLFHLGTLQADDGDNEAALLSLNTFVDGFPEHTYVAQAKQLIEDVNREAIDKPYKIGCLLPLSGPYEIYGYRALKGIEMALNQLFMSDPAPPFQLIIKDSASNSRNAMQAVAEMAEQGVAAIIGPIITAEVAAIEAEIQGVPIITLTQKEDITAIGDYVFRNFITPAMQVEAIVSFATTALDIERFAILFPNENYGRTFMHLFWDQVIAANGKVVGVEMYEPNQTDFVDSIKKLVGLYYDIPDELKTELELTVSERNESIRSNRPLIDLDTVYAPLARYIVGLYASLPSSVKKRKGILFDEAHAETLEPQPTVDFDAIFIPDAPQKAGLIIPQLAFYDVEGIYLLGTNLWHSQTLLKMSREYVQGAIMPDGFFAESHKAIVKQFVERFENIYAEKPGVIEATTYDTATVLFKILSQEDIRFRSALKDALMQVKDFPGVTGRTTFDEQGEAVKVPFLLRVKGDRFIELENR